MTERRNQNLLVILSDEHQSRAMGCAGHDFVKTPNLDALAARGTRFTNAYTPSPIYRHAEDDDGFDHKHIPMMVVDGVGMVWASIRRENERVRPSSRMLGDYIGPGTSRYTEYDAAVTAKTQDWLQSRAPGDDPWCLYVGLVAPHFPFAVPEEFFNLYPPGSLPPVKQHPSTGYRRHPWVERQNALMDSQPLRRIRCRAADRRRPRHSGGHL